MEEKFKKPKSTQKRRDSASSSSASSEGGSESESESEDEGDLVTEQLDHDIFATLNAIRSKDPRVYDKFATFYSQVEEAPPTEDGQKNDEAMTLRDYHRRMLLEKNAPLEAEDSRPFPLDQEQEALRQNLLNQVDAVQQFGDGERSDSGDDDFLKAKPRSQDDITRSQSQQAALDVSQADQDPDKFLTDLMQSRAWKADDHVRPPLLESDDEDEDNRAEAFEQAYNLRFEDPNRTNEKLVSHSRTAAVRQSVRKEDAKGRRAARQVERAKRDAAKRELQDEKRRLRNLKIEEAQHKLRQFKDAAGLRNEDISIDEWAKFLTENWRSSKWDEEMAWRFGDGYYAQVEAEQSDKLEGSETRPRNHSRKPKWKYDIDIGDIDPDFGGSQAQFELSDVENIQNDKSLSTNVDSAQGLDSNSETHRHPLSKAERKKQSRKEKQRIEDIVDNELDVIAGSVPASKKAGMFRYRETSPASFGLNAKDILMADDSQLNQHAGLKKLAAFRDRDKKQRDRRKLGKKARLRKWRRETFGDESGPRTNLPESINNHSQFQDKHLLGAKQPLDSGFAKKKRKRSRKTRASAKQEVESA